MSKFINVHTHIFSANHVPEYVIGQNRWLIPISVRTLQKLGSEVSWLSRILNQIPLRSLNGAKRILEFGKHGLATSQKDQFESLCEIYDSLGLDFRFVILPMDMINTGSGKVKTGLESQLHDIIMLRQNEKAANRLLPFVPVNPLNPRHRDGTAVLKFVRKYIEEEGFIGIKLYPALGYFPFDDKLLEMYAWASENEVPIMVHMIAGSIYWQGSIENYQEILNKPGDGFEPDSEWEELSEKQKLKNRKTFQNNFTQPRNYEVLIKKLENLKIEKAHRLKICFGHFGMERPDWHESVIHLIGKYQNFYADFSYVLADNDLQESMQKVCKPDFIHRHKVLFGTDFFVVSKEKTEAEIMEQYLTSGYGLEPFSTKNAENYLKSNFFVP
jgi:predicted TIM-barrel fold metal-dependent hydrolase